VDIQKEIAAAQQREAEILTKVGSLALKIRSQHPELTYEMCEARAWESRQDLWARFKSIRGALASAGVPQIATTRAKEKHR
jgi:hypothetical protein